VLRTIQRCRRYTVIYSILIDSSVVSCKYKYKTGEVMAAAAYNVPALATEPARPCASGVFAIVRTGNRQITLHDAVNQQELWSTRFSARQFEFSPASNKIVMHCADISNYCTVFYDLASGHAYRFPEDRPRQQVFRLTMNHFGTRLAIRQEKGIRMCNLENGAELFRMADIGPNFCFSGDDTRIVSGDCSKGDSIIHIWDAETGSKLSSFAVQTKSLGAIASGLNGQLCAAPTNEGLKVWDLNSRNTVLQLPDVEAADLLFVEGDTRIIAVGREPQWCKSWDISSGSLVFEIRSEDIGVSDIGFSPQKSAFYLLGGDNKVHEYEASSGREIGCSEAFRFQGYHDGIRAIVVDQAVNILL
jgi:WD40 repeat protein